MAEKDQTFAYVAIALTGTQVRGQIAARSEHKAFEALRREGLAPIQLRLRRRTPVHGVRSARIVLSDRRAAEVFSSLGMLLSAGADIRSALSMLMTRASQRGAAQLCRVLLDEVSGGAKIDVVLSNRLPTRQTFAAALIAAAEASGVLGAGFERAAEVLAGRCKLRDQLVSTLSYPAFVLFSTLAAILMILLFVVPTLAPLVYQSGGSPPFALGVLLWASGQLSANAMTLGAIFIISALGLGLLARLGALSAPLDGFSIDGPLGRIRRGLVYGAFSIVLGGMMSAGAPLSDALRLAIRTAPSSVARNRLEHAASAVRQGQLLSSALDEVEGFPTMIVRMCAVGESSGQLGPMLARAGRLEEDAALRTVEAVGRLLGPALIVLLGGLVGLLMATLLSGVSQIGQGAIP